MTTYNENSQNSLEQLQNIVPILKYDDEYIDAIYSLKKRGINCYLLLKYIKGRIRDLSITLSHANYSFKEMKKET